MWDLVLFKKEKGDDREGEYSVHIFEQENKDEDLDLIAKQFKDQKKILNELDIEIKASNRDVKKRIKELSSSNVRGANEAESKMYDIHCRLIDSRLKIVSERNKIVKDTFDIRMKMDKALNGSGGNSGGGGDDASKMIAMSMLTGSATPIQNQINIINPLNGRASVQSATGNSIYSYKKDPTPNLGSVDVGNDIITYNRTPVTEEVVRTEELQPVYERPIQQQQQTQNRHQEAPQQIDTSDLEIVKPPPGMFKNEEMIDLSDLVSDEGEIDEDIRRIDSTIDHNYALQTLKNRGRKDLEEVIHYVKEDEVFWVETVDKNGNTVPDREKHIVNIKDTNFDFRTMSAEDKLGGKYKVVYDRRENMPEVYDNMWKQYSDK